MKKTNLFSALQMA